LSVTSRFVGNVALKTSEGLAQMITHFMRQAFTRNLLTRFVGLIAAPVLHSFKKRIDPRRYNGASLVGLQGIVIKSHGGADALAFANATHRGGQGGAEDHRRGDRSPAAGDGHRMKYARIVGTGSYLPERVMTNADIERLVDTSDSWIRERTGIRERRIAAEGETTCDLAEKAARRALKAAGVAPREIDLIVVGTTTADQIFPSTACLLQARLGIHGPAAFDVQAVCTGFVYALGVADQDRDTCVLFGDGAGAVVLKADSKPGILSTHLHADGKHADLLQVPGGISGGYEDGRDPYLRMRGKEVFKVATTTLSRIVDETLETNGLSREDVDWLIPHQANNRIIAAIGRKLGLPEERVVNTVAEHGNTSAASVPLALDTAVRDGRIQPGELLLLEAFGGGFTWGSALVRY
jgi:3-oxoacyl-[acyl-carrier-protein] synthase-3